MPAKEGYKPRKAAPRREFDAEDYVRTDWSTLDLADFLEKRARGYNGQLREYLCTAAARLRTYRSQAADYDQAKRELTDEEVSRQNLEGREA